MYVWVLFAEYAFAFPRPTHILIRNKTLNSMFVEYAEYAFAYPWPTHIHLSEADKAFQMNILMNEAAHHVPLRESVEEIKTKEGVGRGGARRELKKREV
jgi:hypothetical protein